MASASEDLARIGGRRLDAMRLQRSGALVTISTYGRLGTVAASPELQQQFLQQAGALLVARMQSAFRAQGRGKPWPERSVPNIMGILADFEAGGTPKKRRWDPKPALVDTGRLRGSIAARVASDHVLVGSAAPYASLMQAGGIVERQVSQGVKDALERWLRRNKQHRPALDWLTRVDSVKLRVPPRPFIELTSQDRQDLQRLAARVFGGAGGTP